MRLLNIKYAKALNTSAREKSMPAHWRSLAECPYRNSSLTVLEYQESGSALDTFCKISGMASVGQV